MFVNSNTFLFESIITLSKNTSNLSILFHLFNLSNIYSTISPTDESYSSFSTVILCINSNHAVLTFYRFIIVCSIDFIYYYISTNQK